MMRLRWFATLVLFTLLAGSGRADTVWREIRDGVVWIRSDGPMRIVCTWRPAWSDRGHMETLYFQDPTGRLLKRRRIDFAEGRGSESFETTELKGDYRLEIPGYTYRAYSVLVPGDAASVFEPVRVHCGIEVARGDRFFFRADGATSFTLGGKLHGGPERILVFREKESRGAMWLFDYDRQFGYARFDRMPLSETVGGVWTLEMPANGKVSFWLDGTPNYFSRRPEQWFVPALEPGVVSVEVGPRVVGEAPGIGSEVEFADLPRQIYDRIATMSMTSVNHYVMQDALEGTLAGKTPPDIRWLRKYEKDLGIADALHIFEPNRKYSDGGVPVPSLMPGYVEFIVDYLARRRGPEGLSVRYVAFFDEPNSRFTDYASFERYFVECARAVRASADPAVRGVRIAAPETAGFANGPTKDDAVDRIGAQWTRRLLETHADLFDAVAWHEWMQRDLIALDWYGEAVAAAASLVRRAQPPGAPAKDLIIGQTNLSSGPDISPYEQETFFTALWWGSAVAHASRTGQLRMIHWTPSLDDPRSAKGLLTSDGALKPVGLAMRFVNQAMLKRVVLCQGDFVETPAVATLDAAGREMRVFLTNNAARQQRMTVRLHRPDGMQPGALSWKLLRLGEDLRTTVAAEGRLGAESPVPWTCVIDGPALYALYLKVE